MKTDLYSAQKLHFDEIDAKYVEQSKAMITVFATITAFENVTREFVYATLLGAYGDEWWNKGIQNGIQEKAKSRRESETKVKWHAQNYLFPRELAAF